ncbi:MAG TPA: glycosyltransferase [Desulfobacterales bacterium]|nr:glycosyltransferase [Desulfobacterales bacterium]
MSPFISVIVPASRTDTLKQTIEGLSNQSIPKDCYEIIVIIPSKLNFEKLQLSRVQVVKTKKLYPPGKMRNLGAQRATGDILCFIDDDCIPSQEWIEIITEKFHKNKDVGAVGCRVIGIENTFWYRCADYALFSRYQYNTPFFGHLGSAAIAIRKKAFLSVIGFQETLLASEDWDLSLKLTKKGWLCLFNPNAEVKHNHQRDGLVSIIVMGFKSGFRSGLVVQAKHESQMSLPAKMLLRLKNPFIYPLAIIPYAATLTLFLIWELRQTEPRLFLFSPFILLSRISYQVGVWVNLLYGNRIIDYEIS